MAPCKSKLEVPLNIIFGLLCLVELVWVTIRSLRVAITSFYRCYCFLINQFILDSFGVHTNYTKYGVECYMIFYVTMVTFQMMVLMNKWANYVMDDGWGHPLAKTLPFSCGQLVTKYCHGQLKFGCKNHLVGDSELQHCKSIITPKIYKEWQIMLG